MAVLNLTPILKMIEKKDDGSYDLLLSMRDPSGIHRGFRIINVNTDGTTTIDGVATGMNLTASQMSALNNQWSTYQTGVNTIDAAGKIPG